MSATIESVRTETGGIFAESWQGFGGGRWQDQIDVRDFIQGNYTPYAGDAAFLAGPTERTRALWARLTAMFPDERARGVYDVDAHTPASITAHAPGYIDREHELIVGLQTDAPLRRAIMPNGGLRMVEAGLAAYGYTLDPNVREIFTRYRKTHNDGVFDAYPPEILAARRAHVITGLPDAYGRGRIIGDYRRVPLYGVDRLDRRQAGREGGPGRPPVHRRDHPRSRGTRRADPRAGRAHRDGRLLRLRHHPPRGDRPGGHPVAVLRPTSPRSRSRTAPRCRSGRTSTFLDIYLERDLAPAVSTETEAQELDRRLRHQAADRPVPAHPGVRRSCSPATRPGSPSRSAGSAATAGRWSPGPASATCRRCTTWGRRPSRT